MYRDLNEDGRIPSSDRTYIGDPNPDFTFGLTNYLSYRDLTHRYSFRMVETIYSTPRADVQGMTT